MQWRNGNLRPRPGSRRLTRRVGTCTGLDWAEKEDHYTFCGGRADRVAIGAGPGGPFACESDVVDVMTR